MNGLDIPREGALGLLSLGALVYRLDPGVVPFRKAAECKIHVSGGEFNVAANLADCFGVSTGIAAAMVFAFVLHKVWPHIHPQHAVPHIKKGPQIGKGSLKFGKGVNPTGPTFEWPVFIAALVFLLAAFSVVAYRIRTRQPLAPIPWLGLEEDMAATIGVNA